MNVLTSQEVEQLIALRLGLTDALTKVRYASKYRRGAAIVALDAMVERASSIVAVTRGLTVPVKLDDLISRIVESLGSAWRPTVLPDVKQLRRARNASQHEGLEPDREQLPLWAEAADSYISTLVEAQFGVDIHRVVLSDAIRDASLRTLVQEAEEAKDLGNYRLSVDKAKESFELALRTWTRLRGDTSSHSEPFGRDILDKKAFDFLKGQLSSIRRVFRQLAFASNVAEAEWFTAAIAERGDVLTAEDADRVLAFAFEWIVECERATEAWTPNRRHRAAVAKRLIRESDCSAHVDECVSVDLEHGTLKTVFRIADVPAQEDYSKWARALQSILKQPSDGWQFMPDVSDDGTVTLSRPADGSVDFAKEVGLLKAALVQAHQVVTEERLLEQELQRARAQEKADFAEWVAAIRDTLPHWVVSLDSSDEPGGAADGLKVTVADEVRHLQFGVATPGAYYDDRPRIEGLFRDQELIENCWSLGTRNQFLISPVPDLQQLIQVFDAVNPLVEAQLEDQRRLASKQQELIENVRAQVAAELARGH